MDKTGDFNSGRDRILDSVGIEPVGFSSRQPGSDEVAARCLRVSPRHNEVAGHRRHADTAAV
jgi:hypothetical protein